MFDYAAKIQALLAKAESTQDQFPAEAAAFRATAERLMDKYRIDQEAALATDPGSSAPIKSEITLWTGTTGMATWYRAVFNAITHHTGCRWAGEYKANGYVGVVVGYEGDVRYTEYLWTAALLMFSTRIDPRWDDTLPEAENIWRLRNAGIQRRVIADRAWGNGAEASARSKVQRIYTRECERRGEAVRAAGLGHQTDVYRYGYAQAFHNTLVARLRDARDAADSDRGGLVLHNRAERVDEAFYGWFPAYRPNPNPEPYVAVPCPKCTADRQCRAHRWSATDEARYVRWNESASARAGQASGTHAAEGVVIGRDAGRSSRVAPATERSAIEG